MVDLHRDLRTPPHLERFAQRIHHRRSFVPQMRDVDPAVAGRHLSERRHLIDVCVIRRHVLQSRGQPERALCHGGVHQRPHPRQFRRGGGAVGETHHALADPGVTGEEPHIRRDLHLIPILIHRKRLILRMQWRQHGGDSLPYEIFRQPMIGERDEMGMIVPEPRRYDLSARVDHARGATTRE